MSEIRYLLIGDGSSPHLVKWVKELTKQYKVFLISSRGILPEISKLLPSDQLFPLGLELKPEGGNLSLIFKIPAIFSILKKIKPTVVNAHYITSNGFVAAMVRLLSFRKFFLVQSAWGTDILVTPFANIFYRFVAGFSLTNAQLITSDSEYMTGIIRKFTKTPVLTFTFGLDEMPEFDLSLKQTGLFFSNRILSDNYNIGEVILFFSRIAKEDDQARLIIANDGELRESLEKLCRDLKIYERVKFCGFLQSNEQIEFYKKAEFFISIPDSDSTSVSLLEAMAHGCIPIVSDIPANKEWIKDGEGGIIYSEELSMSAIGSFRSKEEAAILMNRELISQKAIFGDSIRDYSAYIMKYLEPKK